MSPRKTLDDHIRETQKHIAQTGRLLESTGRKVADAVEHVVKSREKLAGSTKRLKRSYLDPSLAGLRQGSIEKAPLKRA